MTCQSTPYCSQESHIISLYFWRKGVTYIWLVKVFPTAHKRATYSCLAQRNTNSVLVWLQHKPSAHEPLWAREQSHWPSYSICSARTRMCRAALPSEPRTHNVCTLLSAQILLCHKLFQLRRHAIISLITFYFDERSRHFFGKCLFIGLGESSFQFFAYFGTSCVSALGGLQALRGTCIPSAPAAQALDVRHQHSNTGLLFAD